MGRSDSSESRIRVGRRGWWLGGWRVRRWWVLVFGMTLVGGGVAGGLGVGGCATGKVQPRPAHWALRVKKRGLPNLYRVDKGLYRGAQPSRRGMKALVKMGIKTVVNLRSMHSDADELRGVKLAHYHIKFNTVRPKLRYVLRFLRLVGDSQKRPLFVHCAHGADRTGMMVAFYRIIYQGWTKKQAIQEMTRGGYNFHTIWSHLLRFIRKADLAEIRRRLGGAKVKPPAAARGAPRVAPGGARRASPGGARRASPGGASESVAGGAQ